MADEFVDFYEALNLPLEAERKEVRQRIGDLYLEAQRNLDHRNFQTRVEYQRMFEVVLPRARYILLDDDRRAEYDTLVRTFRATAAPAAPAPAAPQPFKPSFGAGDASGFKLEEAEEPAGKAPPIEALPKGSLSAEQMAKQRDEMLAKWKSGLEAAMVREEEKVKTESQRAPLNPAPVAPTTEPAPSAASEAARRSRSNALPISFNFETGQVDEEDEESRRITAFELERQRTERKRTVMKEILDSVSMRGALTGGFGAAVPLGGLLIYLMGHFYPRDAAPALPLPSTAAWAIGIIVIIGATYLAASEIAKSMRHQASIKYAALPLEELLRQTGRTY